MNFDCPDLPTVREPVSHSRHGMWHRCQAQYFFRYIMGMVQPPSAALIRGSAIDNAGNVTLERKLEEDSSWENVKDVTDLAVADFEQRATEVDWHHGRDGQYRDLVDSISSGTAIAHKDLWTPAEPAGVQEMIRYDAPVGNEHAHVYGFNDWRSTDDHVHDLKVISRSWMKGRELTEMQAPLYTGQLFIEQPELLNAQFSYDLLVLTPKGRNSRVETRTLRVSRKDAEFAWREIVKTQVQVSTSENEMHSQPPEEVFSTNRQGMLCSKRHCGYWKECQAMYGGNVRD